jgi:hypothetical protein
MHRMGRISRLFQRWKRSARAGADLARDGDGAPSSVTADLEATLFEVAHERDVSMARAAEAEERARLARDRLESLGSLEQRVEVAERRALDAERRLEEISERVNERMERSDDPPTTEPEPGEPSGDRDADDPADGSTGVTDELRARLARAAERKRSNRRHD